MNPDSTSTFDYHWVSSPMRVDAKAGDVAVNADTVATDTLATDSLKTDSLSADSLRTDSLKAKVDTIPSMFSPTGKSGVMAAPAPYNVATDDVVGSCLMGGLLIAILALAVSLKFVGRQMHNFFYVENDRTTTVPDLPRELAGQWVLVAYCALVMGVATYFGYVTLGGSGEWALPPHTLLAVSVGVFVCYFILKTIAYQFVDWVFFDVKKNEQWNKSQLFLTAMEGLCVTPIVLLLVYGDLSLNGAYVLMAIVVILAKILSFYKCYIIFFRRFGALMQIFLYFCALELVPLAALAGLLVSAREFLQINF